MNQIGKWIAENREFATAVAGFVTMAIIAAMYFGLDLSWIPALLGKIVDGLING